MEYYQAGLPVPKTYAYVHYHMFACIPLSAMTMPRVVGLYVPEFFTKVFIHFAGHAGLEPAVSTVTGWHPLQLD